MGMAVTFQENRACAGVVWRTFWVGLPACGAALGGLLSVADLWGPGRPSQLGASFLAKRLCVAKVNASVAV